MKCVVTGGAGFIGSHLADALLARGDEVHVLDDLSLGKKKNVPSGAIFREGNILDARLLADVLEGASVVFHQAALPSVPRSVEDPLASHDANATGTLRVIDAARRAGVQKVVYAASSSAYGDTPILPKREDMPPAPKSPYAVAKLTGEMYCRVFYEVYGLRTTALRYFNVYGPRQDPQGAYAAVIPRFAMAALEGRPLVVNGDGSNSRDFTFVADAVAANLLAAASTKADGQVVNVGGGTRVTIRELARKVVDLTGSRSEIVHAPPRPGDIEHSLASQEAALALLGYRPTVSLDAGLETTIAWFRSHS